MFIFSNGSHEVINFNFHIYCLFLFNFICQSFNYVNICMDLVGFYWVSPTLAANAGSNVSPELKKKRYDMKKQIKTKAQTHVRN